MFYIGRQSKITPCFTLLSRVVTRKLYLSGFSKWYNSSFDKLKRNQYADIVLIRIGPYQWYRDFIRTTDIGVFKGKPIRLIEFPEVNKMERNRVNVERQTILLSSLMFQYRISGKENQDTW